MKKHLLLLVITLFFSPLQAEEMKPYLPDGLKGLSAKMQGKVISKQESGFVLEIKEVLAVHDNNKADKPKSAVGQKLLINSQWNKNADGWQESEVHRKYIEKLHPGKQIEIDIVNDKKKRFHICSPLLGFMGRVAGEFVEKKGEHQALFKVTEILQVFGDNRSNNYKEIIGRTQLIHVGHRDANQGKKNTKKHWVPREDNTKAIAAVKKGDTLELRIGNWSGGRIEMSDKPKKYIAIPDGMKGFSGKIEGKIVSQTDKGVIISVKKIAALNPDNKSKNYKKLIGKVVEIQANYVKANKKWQRKSGDVNYLKSLVKGNGVAINVAYHDELRTLLIKELTQRQHRKGELDKRAKDKKR